jgi:regulator of protease activity HflC (stomatin/prohibitin superfamily)
MGWEWLSQLLHTFTDLIPRPLIVRTDERCVAFVFGRWPRVLKPGWYFAWPLVSRYETVHVRRQVTSLTQRFGKYAFRWKVVYEIDDALALVTNTYDFDETIADFAEIGFSAVYRTTPDAADMLSAKARKRVIARIRSELRMFGVNVIDFSVVSQSAADCQVSVWELQRPAHIE